MDGASQCHRNEHCILLDKLLATGGALNLHKSVKYGVPLKQKVN